MPSGTLGEAAFTAADTLADLLDTIGTNSSLATGSKYGQQRHSSFGYAKLDLRRSAR